MCLEAFGHYINLMNGCESLNHPFLIPQVTWTRRLGGHTGGIQLLSVGDFTHVQDNRFRVEKKPHDSVSGIV